jgi:hypothetical protein
MWFHIIYVYDVFLFSKHVMLLCAHTAGKLYESVWCVLFPGRVAITQVSGTASVTNIFKDDTYVTK